MRVSWPSISVIPTGDMDDRAALALYRQVARDNRRKREDGDADWQGLAFSLDPATYGAWYQFAWAAAAIDCLLGGDTHCEDHHRDT